MKNQKSSRLNRDKNLSQRLISLRLKNYNYQLTTNNQQRYSAFTLIELLVSIAIVSILASVTYAGYNRLNQRQTLLSAGLTMKNIIRDAQNRAYNSEIDCNVCGGCTPSSQLSFEGWNVDFISRSIYGKCASKTYFSEPFGLSADIIISANPTKILFRSSPLSLDKSAQVCLSYTNLPGSFYSLAVNTAGVITDNGLVASCP